VYLGGYGDVEGGEGVGVWAWRQIDFGMPMVDGSKWKMGAWGGGEEGVGRRKGDPPRKISRHLWVEGLEGRIRPKIRVWPVASRTATLNFLVGAVFFCFAKKKQRRPFLIVFGSVAVATRPHLMFWVGAPFFVRSTKKGAPTFLELFWTIFENAHCNL